MPPRYIAAAFAAPVRDIAVAEFASCDTDCVASPQVLTSCISDIIVVLCGVNCGCVCICVSGFHVEQVVTRISHIATQEKFRIETSAIEALVSSSNGDIRQILNVLMMWRVRQCVPNARAL